MNKRLGLPRYSRQFSASVTSAADPFVLFGPAPVIDGEDPAQYDELLISVSTAVKPADIIEDMWVRDVTDLFWETLRMRRLKTRMMRGRVQQRVLGELREKIKDGAAAEKLFYDWAVEKPRAIKRVNRLLSEGEMNALTTMTLSHYLREFEPIDRLIASAETRRNAALRELDRHRAALAERLRETIGRIEDRTIEGRLVEGDPAGEERLIGEGPAGEERVIEEDPVGEQRVVEGVRSGEGRVVEKDQTAEERVIEQGLAAEERVIEVDRAGEGRLAQGDEAA